jgi:hypothetical protein
MSAACELRWHATLVSVQRRQAGIEAKLYAWIVVITMTSEHTKNKGRSVDEVTSDEVARMLVLLPDFVDEHGEREDAASAYVTLAASPM